MHSSYFLQSSSTLQASSKKHQFVKNQINITYILYYRELFVLGLVREKVTLIDAVYPYNKVTGYLFVCVPKDLAN